MVPLTDPTLSGGQRVILRLMHTRLGRDLNHEQANELWQQCKAHLTAIGLKSTVRECEQSDDGGLDTLPRDDVLDALGKVLANAEWPIYATPEAQSKEFVQRMREALDQRRYAKAIFETRGTHTERISGATRSPASVPKSANLNE